MKAPPATLTLHGSGLTLDDVVRAADGGTVVVADPAALARVAATAAAADRVAATRAVYGRSTGVGANRTVLVDADDDTAAGLLASHAVTAGARRSQRRVRAMLVVRANQLLAGGGGASPAVVEGLLALLADDALPPVRELGGLGTGDLGALAGVGLALAARGVPVGAGDALPLLSSNAATLADAALAIRALTDLAAAALPTAAATYAAVDGNPEAFSAVATAATPFAGARHVATTMRGLVDDRPPRRLQDPFALRTLPQVHGAMFDALARAADVVTRLLGAPAENPLVTGDAVVHHGGFHAVTLAHALDGVRLAALAAARLSTARLALLCDPAATGLPPFLGDPARPGASGVLALEYVAGSAVGDLHLLATPATGVHVAVSRGVEESASFASLSARACLGVVAAFRTVVACETLAALRALAMRDLPRPAAWAGLTLDPAVVDRDLTADLDAVDAVLARV